MSELRAILLAVGVSDARMEEGSLRVDANVSVRHAGSDQYGTRCEVKNMNSLRSLGRAVDYEVARQVALLEAGERVVQETRHWDEDDGRTHSLRSKEEAFDYRYFPEPDLVPVAPSPDWVASVRAALPALPAERRVALASRAGVAPADVATVVSLGLDELVTSAIDAGADPRLALARAGNEVAADIERAPSLEAAAFARVLAMEGEGRLTATQSKQVLGELLASGGDPEEIARAHGFEAMADDSLGAVVDEMIAAHPAEADRLRRGESKLTGFFVGKVMAATAGKADGKAVTRLLRERLG